MSFGKQKAPAPPDYTSIAESSSKAAELSYQLGQQQLDWAKNQYNQYWPFVQGFLQSQTDSTNQNMQRGQDYYNFYNNTYKPIESDFAKTALDYASGGRMEQRAGMAMADVANTFEASRNAAIINLESYGIDPSQTRFGALDLSSRIAEAAAKAAAGTQSRLNTEATGLALKGEAINTGRGYASNVSQAYDTATRAGSAGNQSGAQLYGTGAGAMGSPASYLATGNQANATGAGALNMGYNNQLAGVQVNNAAAAAPWNTLGGLVGGAIGAGILFKGLR